MIKRPNREPDLTIPTIKKDKEYLELWLDESIECYWVNYSNELLTSIYTKIKFNEKNGKLLFGDSVNPERWYVYTNTIFPFVDKEVNDFLIEHILLGEEEND